MSECGALLSGKQFVFVCTQPFGTEHSHHDDTAEEAAAKGTAREVADTVIVFVDAGQVACITVPPGHLPVLVVDSLTGHTAWFEEGHTEDATEVLYA